MQARDLMTRTVATVLPATSVQAAARRMLDVGVSALPVVDTTGRLVGIISEGDLLRRAETGTERRNSWWLGLVASPGERAREFIKSHGSRVGDVMSRQVLTTGPETPVDEIATLLEEHGIKRVPIIDGDKLVGIVSRADLLRALAVRKLTASAPRPSDAQLRDAIDKVLLGKRIVGGNVSVVVDGGIAHFWGTVETNDERRALGVVAETVPGVAAVVNHVCVIAPVAATAG